MARERMIMVRVPEELHKAVRVKAAELGRPIAEIARGLLQAWVEGRVDTPPPEVKPKSK